MRQIFEKAAVHLRSRGHIVDITVLAQEVLSYINNNVPDVLIFSYFLKDMDGFELRDELHKRYPDLKTKLIWMAALRSDGEPVFSWEMTDISMFLPFPCSEWVVVLAVEQLLYRTVLGDLPQLENKNAS